MRLLGRKLGIFINNGLEEKPIGLSTSASITITTDMVEAASASAKAKSFLPGRYTFTMQCEKLYDATEDDGGFNMQRYLLLSQLNGRALDFVLDEAKVVDGSLAIDPNSALTIRGQVYVNNFTENAAADGYANVSISFQGSGELDIAY